MATYGVAPEDQGGLQSLLETSPDPEVHTSAAAEIAFLLGIVGLAAAPFSVTQGVAITASVPALLLGLVGMARTSNRYVAGRALVPMAIFFALGGLIIVGLRYLGLDTAFGDELLPTMGDWLDALNERVGL